MPRIGASSPWPRFARFDPETWRAAIIDAVTVAVRVSAQKAMESAQEDAPVRDVFKHGNAYRRRGLRRRRLSLEEVASEIAVRQQLGLGHGTIGTRGTRFRANPYLRRAAPRRHPNAFHPFINGREITGGRQTAVGRLRAAEAQDALNARGRYELSGQRLRTRTGERMSAIFHGRDATTLGGRLRGEIHMTGPSQMGSIIEARVVSPTYYAKYQEFGTRHNRATPYLRPAIAKLHSSYRNEVVKALNRTNWQSRG